MTAPETPVTSKGTKTVIIVVSVLGVITAVLLTIFAVFLFKAPETPETIVDPNSQQPLSSELVPEVQTFQVTQRETGGQKADYSFTVPEITDNLIVEYRVEDDQLNVLDSGSFTEPGDTAGAVLLKDGTKNVALMFRAVSGKKATGWLNVSTVSVTVDIKETVDERPVDPAYYETDWALKKDDSVTALQEAFIVAFDAPPVTDTDYDKCYLGNSVKLLAGEIIRPRPELGKEYQLKTSIYKDSTEYNVDFVWCEK